MIKELFLSLFKPQKGNLIDNNNTEILLPEIPFYGVGGTICCIEEAPESYYKVLYNQDGTISPQKIPVPKKKKKNFNFILKDYCNDLEKYLKLFQNQYLKYDNSNITPTLTDKQYHILIIVTSLATIASIPFLLTTAVAGLVFGTFAGFSCYIVYDIHKKDIQKITVRNNFIKQYNELQRRLVNYRSDNPIFKERKPETIYTKIDKVDKSYLKIFPKIKILKKEESQETA